MPEETLDVIPSEENGNVTAMDTTPIESPKEEAPAPSEPAPEVEPTLYELPDGRKVDGEILAKEWKENFLPEFTRKSQALAEIEKQKNFNSNKNEENPYADPEYVPQSYDEIIKAAKEETIRELKAEQLAETEKMRMLENEISSQIAEIKKTDPGLDENSLFLHANNFGFKDLNLAYKNMKYVNDMLKNVQQTTAKNIAKRIDPVSVSNNPSGNSIDPSHFGSSLEFLRAVKGTT